MNTRPEPAVHTRTALGNDARRPPPARPHTQAETGKASRKPPVGPKNTPKPPLPPEKTGSPNSPAARNSRAASAPSRGPSTSPARVRNMVCRVMGTGPMGMLIQPPTASKAANRAMSTRRCLAMTRR